MAEFSVPRAEPLEAGSLPLERDGCRISRSESHPYEVRHDRFPDRQWRACDAVQLACGDTRISTSCCYGMITRTTPPTLKDPVDH